MKVPIVPCSGIGKSYGSVAREGAYAVTDDLCPGKSRLVPLALLARSALAEGGAITIDGCKLACAAKVVEESGGKIAHKLQVFDVFRRHRDLKPLGIAHLDENGKKLAQVLATEIRELVESMQRGIERA